MIEVSVIPPFLYLHVHARSISILSDYNPPDVRDSLHAFFAMVGDGLPFVVGVLPSTGLEGAFRVHLTPESLEKIGLKVGELCQITGENGDLGYGIAWRATDKMGTSPKLRPAKMTDIMRAAFGFTEGSHVMIVKTTAQISHAHKVSISDAMPIDPASDASYNSWRIACTWLLNSCEAFTNSIMLDVTAKKGLKKRFFIDHVESSPSTPSPVLYYIDDDTQITFGDGYASSSPSLQTGNSSLRIETSRIGGLVKQIEELNECLEDLLDSGPTSMMNDLRSHVLIHGYEGTGKSLLLDRVQQVSNCKVFKLERSTMAANTITKNQVLIRDTFKKALQHQPSLVVIDDLEKLVPVDDEVLSVIFRAELESLQGSRVLIIAATRVLLNVNALITLFEGFDHQIELSIPDVTTRKQILGIKLESSDAAMFEWVSGRTHGYTGRDLALLVRKAQRLAQRRLKLSRKQQIQAPDTAAVSTPFPDSRFSNSGHDEANAEAPEHSEQAQTHREDLESQASTVTCEDFDVALASMRPTALREIFLETPKVQWSDIGGSESIQRQFNETLGWPLNFSEAIGRYRISSMKGILLYGPPGCSKTLTAQAVANTYGLNFMMVKGPELVSMYVGESERAMREIFRKARQAAPCVIFFDEFEAIGSKRDSSSTKGLHVVSTLLNEMDGFETLKGVLILAATNQPDILDPALLRPGRFDLHVYISVPDEVARRAIVDLSIEGRTVADGVDLDQLAKDTQGYSGAEIANMCMAAKVASLRRVGIEVAQAATTAESLITEDFAVALEKVTPRITKDMLQVYDDFARRSAT